MAYGLSTSAFLEDGPASRSRRSSPALDRPRLARSQRCQPARADRTGAKPATTASTIPAGPLNRETEERMVTMVDEFTIAITRPPAPT